MAQCNICKTELVYREPREGQSWKPFWGCPNYRKHPAKTAPQATGSGEQSGSSGWNAVAAQLKALKDEIKILADKISKLSILDENPQDFQ